MLVLFCKLLDLSRDIGDPLIELSPVVDEALDKVDDPRRQDVGSLRED